MANRDNHYEAAFEAYLQAQRVAYVAVNEQRRSRIAGGSLKNVDFLVSPDDGATYLVDVKGRRFPSGNRSKQYWKNWSTWDDLQSLARWQDALGPGAVALFAFAYHVVGELAPTPAETLFTFRNRLYAFLAVRVVDYIQGLRPLSRKWQTVTMPVEKFREAAIPFDRLLNLATKIEHRGQLPDDLDRRRCWPTEAGSNAGGDPSEATTPRVSFP